MAAMHSNNSNNFNECIIQCGTLEGVCIHCLTSSCLQRASLRLVGDHVMGWRGSLLGRRLHAAIHHVLCIGHLNHHLRRRMLLYANW